jgi:hypothetical protein
MMPCMEAPRTLTEGYSPKCLEEGFSELRLTALLGSSCAEVHSLREVLLGELSGGWYLLDDVDHDPARCLADEVALPNRQILKRLEYLHSRCPKPLVLALHAGHLEVEKQRGGRPSVALRDRLR